MLTREKIFFTEHLSLMIKGGTPVAEALGVLKQETELKSFKKILEGILKQVQEGENLSKSFERYPKIFDKFFCGIVKAGEETGTLDENLKYLAEQLRKNYEMQRSVIGALIYPTFVICLALAIAFGISFFILPKIVGLLQALEIKGGLPLPTRILISFTSFFKGYWAFILSGIAVGVLGINLLRRIKFIGFYIDRASFSLPFFGKILSSLNLARFSRIFYVSFKAGVPLLEALMLCSDTIPNLVYKKNLIQIKKEIARGMKISDSLKKIPKTFPPFYSQMILVGERSGTLEESLLYLAEFHERETETNLKNLSRTLEPLLLILVGLFVGFIAISIITPIYKFVGGMGIR